MESELLPILKDFLIEEHHLREEDIDVSLNTAEEHLDDYRSAVSGVSTEIFLKEKESLLCSWSEFPIEGEETLFFVDWAFQTRENAINILKLFIRESNPLCKFHLERLGKTLQRNSFLEQENKKLSQGNEKLRQKNRKLRYSPGGSGFSKAREHFLGLL
ncbi:hypothetical protein MEL_006 [Melbournevirus]|uniref:hypothetical protein n=1 Tax=Melbournevirus TaxID=1560514 RepID=UPI00051F58EC|nr:hypothetical protein MEL_006 [Melbournevirus]AIT54619.1 hypothetical protein MEL_006 [Melbournevirus]